LNYPGPAALASAFFAGMCCTWLIATNLLRMGDKVIAMQASVIEDQGNLLVAMQQKDIWNIRHADGTSPYWLHS